MTSIEALLTNETTEIAFKVRQRVAKLVSYFDFDPIMVSEHIKMSYTVRSKLVHGSSPVSNNNLQEFSRKHIHDVLNYNRICLCISLQLKNIISKSDLIKKIDNAFIDLRANEELKMLIKENVVLPIQL